MATSVDTLIANATLRANYYATTTDNLVAQLRELVAGTTTVPNTASFNIDAYEVPTYTAPDKATNTGIPLPSYEEPSAAEPAAPIIASLPTIPAPPAREVPTIDVSDLFKQTAPDYSVPAFTAGDNKLNIETLLAELTAIAEPIISEITLPEVSLFSIGAAPTIAVPTFDSASVNLPGALPEPVNYATYMKNLYSTTWPEIQSVIADKTDEWVAKYAPSYQAWAAQMQTAITEGLAGQTIPDDLESAMFTRARGRTNDEFKAVEEGLLSSYAKTGFVAPPGAMVSGLHMGRLKNANALANVSTDIYTKRIELEIQNRQFLLGIASSQIAGVQNALIGYIGTLTSSFQLAESYSSAVTENVAKVFDKLEVRARLSLSVAEEIRAQYDTRLKAALSELEGYKLELEALRARTDIDTARIQQAHEQVVMQQLKIERYTAVIDAVAKKATIEELKLKELEVQASLYSTAVQGKRSAVDAYTAAIQGDQAKLEGELSKLKIVDEQIQIDKLNVDVQSAVAKNTALQNEAELQSYTGRSAVYKLALDVALQKFTVAAEMKKLGSSLYGQEIANSAAVYSSALEIPKVKINAVLEEAKIRTDRDLKTAELTLDRLRLQEQASAAGVAAFEGMASATLGSLNSVVSNATSAAL